MDSRLGALTAQLQDLHLAQASFVRALHATPAFQNTRLSLSQQQAQQHETDTNDLLQDLQTNLHISIQPPALEQLSLSTESEAEQKDDAFEEEESDAHQSQLSQAYWHAMQAQLLQQQQESHLQHAQPQHRVRYDDAGFCFEELEPEVSCEDELTYLISNASLSDQVYISYIS
eukprot:m.149453 g.149453  ORF g.149453 m.149453 type:complete len:173 (+) comp52771_c0_seq1:108-626(+)